MNTSRLLAAFIGLAVAVVVYSAARAIGAEALLAMAAGGAVGWFIGATDWRDDEAVLAELLTSEIGE